MHEHTKSRVLDTARWLSDNGYFGGRLNTGGNVSSRTLDPGVIAITPSSFPYHQMTPGDICLVDMDMGQVEGGRTPSMEIAMHLAVYQHRPDISAVIHTHQMYASIFSVINAPIPALFDETCMALGHITEMIPYALSGTPDLARNVAAKLGNGCMSYLLQNHGALVLGVDLDTALVNVELLEKTAGTYYRALATGRSVTFTPQSTIDHFKKNRGAP